MSKRKFLVRKEGLTSFRELCEHNPMAIDIVNGQEIWDSDFDGAKWSRFMDYWQIDRAVVQTSPPGFDGLVAYKLDEAEMDLQVQACLQVQEG